MYQKIADIQFPAATGININMMPIIMGDIESVPPNIRQYAPILAQCSLTPGSTVYLTVNEAVLQVGAIQRGGPYLHTDATSINPLGGGHFYEDVSGYRFPTDGIYIASTDGRCRVWNTQTGDVDLHGLLPNRLDAPSDIFHANALYWMTDRTPHEGLAAERDGMRQFFRLTSQNIGQWFSMHYSENPLGIPPQAPMSDKNHYADIKVYQFK